MLWKEEYATGNALIDNQHRELFNRLQQVIDALAKGREKAVLLQTVGFLKTYTFEHFTEEEEIMEASSYPDYDRHCGEHRQFIQDLLAFEDDLFGGREGGKESADKLIAMMVTWLVHHILSSDQSAGRFMREKK